eukprot:2947411-Pyramimonas_sp.AAC.1
MVKQLHQVFGVLVVCGTLYAFLGSQHVHDHHTGVRGQHHRLMNGLPGSTEQQPHRQVRVFTRDSSGSLVKKHVRGYPEPVRAKFTDALATLRNNVSPHVRHWNFTGIARKVLPHSAPERPI